MCWQQVLTSLNQWLLALPTPYCEFVHPPVGKHGTRTGALEIALKVRLEVQSM